MIIRITITSQKVSTRNNLNTVREDKNRTILGSSPYLQTEKDLDNSISILRIKVQLID